MPVRLATRKMCVSTAMVGWPNAVLRITFAVFLPTPGRRSSAPRGEEATGLDDGLRLGAVHADRAYVIDQAVHAQGENSPRRAGPAVELFGREIHALGGGLRREHDRYQQLEGRPVSELGGRVRVRRAQPLENLPALERAHGRDLRARARAMAAWMIARFFSAS